LQPLTILLRHTRWILEHPHDLVPDRLVQAVHAQFLVGAQAGSSPAIGIRRTAAIIGIAGIVGPSVVGIAAARTDEESLQQIAAALERDAGAQPILLQLLLDRSKQLLIHQGRHRDGDPLLGWGSLGGPAAPGLRRPATWRAQAWLLRDGTCASERSATDIGGILQHVPDGAMGPAGLACPRGHAGRLQPAPHLLQGAAFLSDPGEDLPHHPCLIEDDVETSGAACLLRTHQPITIRGLAEHTHPPSLGRVPLAAPTALEELGPLVFGDHPLDLQQQLLFRGLGCGMVEEPHLYAGAREFL
jgi:hypothetical protein